MLCANPYTQGNHAYGCGQCMPCRYNRRRVWTHRIILEALVHAEASFITLTYDEEHLPDDNSLSPRDLQLFIKRLRERVSIPLRFFAVGEYGERGGRPHYHAAMFGLGCQHKAFVDAAWGKGLTSSDPLEFHSAAYVCGYVTKKLTRAGDPRLEGRHPEFARMSRRPGIGGHSIEQIAEVLQSRAGWDEIDRTSDVPQALRHGRRTLPLGNYLRRRLRRTMGFENVGQSKEASLAQSQEMLALWLSHVEAEANPTLTMKALLVSTTKQKRRNLETRLKIVEGRKL